MPSELEITKYRQDGFQTLVWDAVGDGSGLATIQTKSALFGHIHKLWIVPDLTNPPGDAISLTAYEVTKLGHVAFKHPSDILGGIVVVPQGSVTTWHQSNFSAGVDGWVCWDNGAGPNPTITAENSKLKVVQNLAGASFVGVPVNITADYLDCLICCSYTLLVDRIDQMNQVGGTAHDQGASYFFNSMHYQSGAYIDLGGNTFRQGGQESTMPVDYVGIGISSNMIPLTCWISNVTITTVGGVGVPFEFPSGTIAVGSHLELGLTGLLNGAQPAGVRVIMVVRP